MSKEEFKRNIQKESTKYKPEDSIIMQHSLALLLAAPNSMLLAGSGFCCHENFLRMPTR